LSLVVLQIGCLHCLWVLRTMMLSHMIAAAVARLTIPGRVWAANQLTNFGLLIPRTSLPLPMLHHVLGTAESRLTIPGWEVALSYLAYVDPR
jgi:hypothetical protein